MNSFIKMLIRLSVFIQLSVAILLFNQDLYGLNSSYKENKYDYRENFKRLNNQKQALLSTSERYPNKYYSSGYLYLTSSSSNLRAIKCPFSFIVNKSFQDTIANQYYDKYISTLEDDRLRGGRTARWYYGWIIYREYPLLKKIFGGGFSYLTMFGDKFGETEYDYPHNPFISTLLYSGIIGALIYTWFIVLVFWYYIKYMKHHFYFFVCFMAIFFFSFVSANTHYSIPIFAIFCIIPFLTKYIVEKERLEESEHASRN